MSRSRVARLVLLLIGALLGGGQALAADTVPEKAALCATCHG